LSDITIIRNGYGAPEYERHLTRRHELAQRLADTTQLFYSLVGISVMSAFRLELNSALNIGMKLLGIADHERDPHMQLEARGALANALWMMGDVAGARDHAERGLALFEHRPRELAGKEHMLAACQLYSCFCTAAMGYPDKALRLAFEFLAAARERGQLLPLAFALNIVATMMVWRGEGEQAVKYSDALLAVSVEHGFTNWVSFGQIDHGHALALAGRGKEGVVEIIKALDTFKATGAAIPGWAFASLAFSCLAAAQPEEGMTATASGLEQAEKTGDRESEAELYRLQGELMLMRDRDASAEPSFRRAIDAARSRTAKIIELRATTSLARLLVAQGKRDEARATLAEIYGWFTEGFDTADLRDARTLLDEWNS
jgi:tetratricopeptide (TPR) repeat protein